MTDFAFNVPGEPVSNPGLWTRSELGPSESWIRRLSDDALAALDSALATVESHGLEPGEFGPGDFPLGSFTDEIAGYLDELESGRGFVLIRGVPVEKYTVAQLEKIFWGMGRHIGTPLSINADGHRLGHVIDLGYDANNTKVRNYQTTAELRFHNDMCDVIGLMCINTAKSGGRSGLASVPAIHNTILHEEPDLLRALYQPMSVDRRGEPGTSRRRSRAILHATGVLVRSGLSYLAAFHPQLLRKRPAVSGCSDHGRQGARGTRPARGSRDPSRATHRIRHAARRHTTRQQLLHLPPANGIRRLARAGTQTAPAASMVVGAKQPPVAADLRETIPQYRPRHGARRNPRTPTFGGTGTRMSSHITAAHRDIGLGIATLLIACVGASSSYQRGSKYRGISTMLHCLQRSGPRAGDHYHGPCRFGHSLARPDRIHPRRRTKLAGQRGRPIQPRQCDLFWSGTARMIVVIVLLVALYLSIPHTGILLATAVILLFLIWFGGERRWRFMVPVAIVLPAALYLFFVKVAHDPVT